MIAVWVVVVVGGSDGDVGDFIRGWERHAVGKTYISFGNTIAISLKRVGRLTFAYEELGCCVTPCVSQELIVAYWFREPVKVIASKLETVVNVSGGSDCRDQVEESPVPSIIYQ